LSLLSALVRRSDAPQIKGFDRFGWVPINENFFQRISVPHAPNSQRQGLSTAGDRGTKTRFLRLRNTRAYSAIRNQIAAQVRAMAFSAKSKTLTLFHAFNYLAPAAIARPIVPVVYDLSFIRFPGTHPPARLAWLATLGKRLQTAPVVHTISYFSASEITQLLAIPPSRIIVIYPGVRAAFAVPCANPTSILVDYGLNPGGYFLTVSTLEPRKNLRTVVNAFSRLRKSVRERMPLCIAGQPGWGNLDLPPQWESLQQEGTLRFLGFVPDTHLHALYTGAQALLYPSIYEGFGLPIIEALACGTSVICSDATSMPEAIGEAGRRVPPLEVDAWTEELIRAADERAAGNNDERQLRRAHAAQFTWDRAAAQAIALYNRVAAEV
jgi:alpha-1,3-rhamnosyl/mannosyltransferase